MDVGPVGERQEFPPLNEADVTQEDRLDDRVEEGDGLPRAELLEDDD